jgi:hypothetical protein
LILKVLILLQPMTPKYVAAAIYIFPYKVFLSCSIQSKACVAAMSG